MVAWLAGWLVGWLLGWLVGWFPIVKSISRNTYEYIFYKIIRMAMCGGSGIGERKKLKFFSHPHNKILTNKQ